MNKNIQIQVKQNIVISDIYDTYWKFAAERQKIFFARIDNKAYPWTEDEVLLEYKFTNAYRASDRVSQYLIKNVIYKGEHSEESTIFRILLFKLFNKIETWKSLENRLGTIEYHNFNFKQAGNILSNIMHEGNAIYSAAYIMASGKKHYGFERKHLNHLALLKDMMEDGFTSRVNKCKSLKELYELIIQYPSLGKFLAYQYAIDINYSNVCDFDESEFVIAGPGAISGIEKCFKSIGKASPEYVIKYMVDIQEKEFERLGLDFKNLWGRRLQSIDCQNIFCETDKYARIVYPMVVSSNGRKRIKQKFSPNLNEIEYYYPPKWGINQNISR